MFACFVVFDQLIYRMRLLRLVIALVILSLQDSCSALDSVYNVPVFDIQDLVSGVADERLKEVLASSGLLSIRLPTPTRDANRVRRGLEGLCSCRTKLAQVRGGDVSTLSDGRTTRSSMATATVGTRSPLPLPLTDLQSTCKKGDWINDLEWIRDTVSLAVDQAFVPAMDRLISSESYLLQSQDGTQYFSVRSILQDSVHLEHFHVYSSPNITRTTSLTPNDDTDDRHVIDSALDFHTDAGLFLAFLPSISCSPSNVGVDESFSIRVPQGNQMVEKKVLFPLNSGRSGHDLHIAIMLGEGAQNWLQKSGRNVSLKATVHAVKMKKGYQRVWYGTMYLVPKNAIIQTLPDPYTFSDMKRSMATLHSSQRVFQSGQLDQSQVILGCGSNQPSHVLGQRSSYRARLQMVNGPADCSNSSNFYCWMSCQSLPDDVPNIQDASVQAHLQQGDSLYCLSGSVLATSANISKAVEACRDPISGVYGGAMDTSCVTRWHSSVSGVYSLLSTSSDSATSIPLKYCYGGTTMYMNGFVWEDANCIIYLFHGWVISSRGLLVLACISTALLGVFLETLVWIRRKYLSTNALISSKAKGSLYRKIIPTALGYAIQLLFGYFLMLIVMTYSGPLVISVIVGLVSGHIIFQWHDVRSVKGGTLAIADSTGSLSLTEEDHCRGFTPCCDNGS